MPPQSKSIEFLLEKVLSLEEKIKTLEDRIQILESNNSSKSTSTHQSGQDDIDQGFTDFLDTGEGPQGQQQHDSPDCRQSIEDPHSSISSSGSLVKREPLKGPLKDPLEEEDYNYLIPSVKVEEFIDEDEAEQDPLALDPQVPSPDDSMFNNFMQPPLSGPSTSQALQFNPKSNLKALPKRNHRCKICPKAFRTLHILKDHILTHLPKAERPYSCPSCNKRFAKPYDLKRHTFTHSQVKPYTCKFCNRSFIRADQRTKHEIKHLQMQSDLSLNSSY